MAAVKRPGDDEDVDMQAVKKGRGAGSMVLKMLIPDHEVGNVIGKGGTILKGICEGAGVRVRISAMDEVVPVTRERIATITGPLEGLDRAQHLITEALHLGRTTKAARDGVVEADTSDTRQLKLLFPHNSIGVVMGKGGTFIKEITQSTGAKIKVSQAEDMIQATLERTIHISGTVEALDAAQHSICQRLAEAPLAQQLAETDYSILKMAGGHPGMMMPPKSSMAARRSPYEPDPSARLGYPPSGGSIPYGAMPFKQFMATLDDHISPSAAQQKYDEYLRLFGPGQIMAPPQPLMQAPPPAATGAIVKAQMSLPDKKVSAVIGKGGTMVKEIVRRSGARIHASPKSADATTDERVIEVSGSQEQVAMAQQLINERVASLDAMPQGHSPAPLEAMPQVQGAAAFGPPTYAAPTMQQPMQPAMQPPHGMAYAPPAGGEPYWDGRATAQPSAFQFSTTRPY